MKKLIEAMNIFLTAGDKEYPFNCSHDELVVDYDPSDFSEAEIKDLERLGFLANHSEGHFYSFKYGSC